MSAAGAALWLWLAYAVSWAAAGLWTARATTRAGRGEGLAYLAGFALGFGLLFPTPGAGGALMAGGGGADGWRWGLVTVEAGGFAFAWWARVHLGRLWSGMMTLRDGHRVIESGPYGLVRHPIYTGLIASGWALAFILSAPRALAGAVVLTIVMAIKARNEERLLRATLGPAAYDGYAARVPMLVPFMPRLAAGRRAP
ncbi:methyltransferase family protein [Sphingomonas solaris]|uniref:Isoprenylcysteine carboxylmethyltransferase family protein n=1 Tax=Alterirhizorhabdus solaris TaxID=2529389 RepID=A0A558QVE8_9SPHN|nr:isoprenylcysteine carboxylmethyltransferase family protein [Sphingomonas solaris]TVV71120.1 isoprenylcysteine carboxylmethyltransferase family protein [Sphingomonas solaris]